MVDEFEALLALPVAADLPRFFAQLRAMMSADLMTMVIASIRPLTEYSSDLAIFDGLTSPFANYFTTFYLKPLDDADAEVLLRGASNDQLTDKEIPESRRWAGGQPCLLQVAAAAWHEAKRKGRTEEWVYQRREELKHQNYAPVPPAIRSGEEIRSHNPTRDTLATLTFVGFVLLLAFRDVATELFLSTQTATKEKTLWLSFAVCGTILALSCIRLLVTGQSCLLKKLRTPGALRRATVLGLFSGGIYFGIFFIIGQLGAGVAGLIDAGLIPLATAIVGAVMFKEKLTTNFYGAFAVYLLGITILVIARNEFIPLWLLGVAVLPPVATAL